MAYLIIRFIFRITIKFYFRKLQVSGAENIPDKGPVFLVANHPSAFMDPIVVGVVTKRPLFFLGKGILFENKMLGWLLSKFHVIPIFRSNETPGQANKNKDIFSKCYNHFAKGGALLAFPEGISLTERKIKKIQSGTARICLGAEAQNNFSLDIKIVTVGLNFSNPHKFQSDLFVNIDKPINVSDYYELYKQDSFKAAHALTDEIRRRLEKQVVAIQDSDVDDLVSKVELMYKAQIIEDLGHSPKEMVHDFNTTRSIHDSVRYFMERDPGRVENLRNNIDSYLSALDSVSLNDKLIQGVGKSSPILGALGSLLYLILGLPVFIYGFLNNFLPFRIPFWSIKLFSKRIEFHGPIAFMMGTFTFLIFYSVQIWLMNKYISDWRIVLAYAISLPITGLFAFYYFKKYRTTRGNWKIFSLFYKRTTLITSLISKRQEIINELESARKEYVAYRDHGIEITKVKEAVESKENQNDKI